MKKKMWRERREKERESDYETEEEIDIQEEADQILEILEELEKERDLEIRNINIKGEKEKIEIQLEKEKEITEEEIMKEGRRETDDAVSDNSRGKAMVEVAVDGQQVVAVGGQQEGDFCVSLKENNKEGKCLLQTTMTQSSVKPPVAPLISRPLSDTRPDCTRILEVKSPLSKNIFIADNVLTDQNEIESLKLENPHNIHEGFIDVCQHNIREVPVSNTKIKSLNIANVFGDLTRDDKEITDVHHLIPHVSHSPKSLNISLEKSNVNKLLEFENHADIPENMIHAGNTPPGDSFVVVSEDPRSVESVNHSSFASLKNSPTVVRSVSETHSKNLKFPEKVKVLAGAGTVSNCLQTKPDTRLGNKDDLSNIQKGNIHVLQTKVDNVKNAKENKVIKKKK